jgi:uncharacterized surface protein with fasciclin (FAS1) repeats
MRRTLVGVVAASLMLVGIAGPATARAPRAAPSPGSETIASLADGSLLGGALDHAGLTGVFEGRGQYTVFAPSDDAFLDLLAVLEPVLDDSIENPFEAIDAAFGGAPIVEQVLLYHVTEGRRAANSVVPPRGERTITTLRGDTFAVGTGGTIVDGAAAVFGPATIGPANISASNGIVHGVDRVLLPADIAEAALAALEAADG